MKRISIFLLLIFLLWISCRNELRIEIEKLKTADSLSYFYDNKPFTGIAFKEYTISKLHYEKQFRDGKQNGIITFWYENGEKKSEGKYINNSLNGKFISWYENGKIKQNYISMSGKILGQELEYYNNGQMKDSSHFFNGKLDISKPSKQWYKNGSLMQSIIPIDNGKGLNMTMWNENGKKESEIIFTDMSFENVSFKVWDEEGNMIEPSFKEFLIFLRTQGLDFGYNPTLSDLQDFNTSLRDSAINMMKE